MTGMLKDLAELESRFGEKAVDDARRASNLLLRSQFLFAGDRGATQAYETLTSARFRFYFDALFDALGYVVRRNETEQWIGIIPDSDLDFFPKMRTEHTLVLLVLALTWQEEVNRGGAEARAVVVTTLNALFERYRDLTARGRKESLSTARFEEGLRELERRSLVSIGTLDPDENDKQIEIRPMVHLLVDGNAQDRLERFAAEADSAVRTARRRIEQDERQEGDEGLAS